MTDHDKSPLITLAQLISAATQICAFRRRRTIDFTFISAAMDVLCQGWNNTAVSEAEFFMNKYRRKSTRTELDDDRLTTTTEEDARIKATTARIRAIIDPQFRFGFGVGAYVCAILDRADMHISRQPLDERIVSGACAVMRSYSPLLMISHFRWLIKPVHIIVAARIIASTQNLPGLCIDSLLRDVCLDARPQELDAALLSQYRIIAVHKSGYVDFSRDARQYLPIIAQLASTR